MPSIVYVFVYLFFERPQPQRLRPAPLLPRFAIFQLATADHPLLAADMQVDI